MAKKKIDGTESVDEVTAPEPAAPPAPVAPGRCLLQAPPDTTSITIPVGIGGVETRLFQVVNGRVDCPEEFSPVLQSNGFQLLYHNPAVAAEGTGEGSDGPASDDTVGGAGDPG